MTRAYSPKSASPRREVKIRFQTDFARGAAIFLFCSGCLQKLARMVPDKLSYYRHQNFQIRLKNVVTRATVRFFFVSGGMFNDCSERDGDIAVAVLVVVHVYDLHVGILMTTCFCAKQKHKRRLLLVML